MTFSSVSVIGHAPRLRGLKLMTISTTNRIGIFVNLILALALLATGDRPPVRSVVHLQRVPFGGIQPQAAIDEKGVLHLVYFAGEAAHGNLFYVRSNDGGFTFSEPMRVNSQPGSAIATGTIRGAQIAIGKHGRVNVAWNGSSQAVPKAPMNPGSGGPRAPMLYARMNAANEFEPERNLMLRSSELDGGGSVAADRAGNVYVAWHASGSAEQQKGEGGRQVWIARSQDDGRSFSAEQKGWQRPTGACACCGMKIFARPDGTLYALYRSATESVHRDIYLLVSKDKGRTFQGRLLHKWDINACPMSSMDLAGSAKAVIGAWETGGQVFWARLNTDGPEDLRVIAAPGEGKNRKHPRVAISEHGEVLLVWTEGTGWQRGGSLAWQLFDSQGQPTTEHGESPGVPVWSFAAAAWTPDRGFSILF